MEEQLAGWQGRACRESNSPGIGGLGSEHIADCNHGCAVSLLLKATGHCLKWSPGSPLLNELRDGFQGARLW